MRFKLPITLLLFSFSCSPLYANSPVLSSDNDIATAGYFQLSWKYDGNQQMKFELQESVHDPNFGDAKTIYRGQDISSVLSGKPDGQYFYRVRAVHQNGAAPWSESAKVVVAHHRQGKTFAFFLAGLIVFLATAVFIVMNSRRQP